MEDNHNIDGESDVEINEDKSDTKEEAALAKIEREKQELLSNIGSHNINSLKDRVGYILNHYSYTRNSDIDLAWKYWQLFDQVVRDGGSITRNQMLDATRISSLSRVRAKIQNEYKLFEADEDVKVQRKQLQAQNRLSAIMDKPEDYPSSIVFLDETGKTDSFLCVGSLWIIEGGSRSYRIKEEIDKWKKENGITYEFHFKEAKRDRLQGFKDFFRKYIVLNPTCGFKLIAVKNTGFRDINAPITELTFHVIKQGLASDHDTGRAPLPRNLQIWMDQDSQGSDHIKVANLRDRIESQQNNGVRLRGIDTVDSQSHYSIQAVDLFTAAVNRKLNVTSEKKNHKDELADYILRTVNFPIETMDKTNEDVDSAVVYNLSNFSKATEE